MDLNYLAERIDDEKTDWYLFDTNNMTSCDILDFIFKLYLKILKTNILEIKEIYDTEYINAGYKISKLGYKVLINEYLEEDLCKIDSDYLVSVYSRMPEKFMVHENLEIFLDNCKQNNVLYNENDDITKYSILLICNNDRYLTFRISLENYNKRYAEITTNK